MLIPPRAGRGRTARPPGQRLQIPAEARAISSNNNSGQLSRSLQTGRGGAGFFCYARAGFHNRNGRSDFQPLPGGRGWLGSGSGSIPTVSALRFFLREKASSRSFGRIPPSWRHSVQGRGRDPACEAGPQIRGGWGLRARFWGGAPTADPAGHQRPLRACRLVIGPLAPHKPARHTLGALGTGRDATPRAAWHGKARLSRPVRVGPVGPVEPVGLCLARALRSLRPSGAGPGCPAGASAGVARLAALAASLMPAVIMTSVGSSASPPHPDELWDRSAGPAGQGGMVTRGLRLPWLAARRPGRTPSGEALSRSDRGLGPLEAIVAGGVLSSSSGGDDELGMIERAAG